MGPVSKFMTGMFAVDAAKGAGEGVKHEIKNPGNKYDDILGNKLIKAPKAGGTMNALNANPMYKRASDEINERYNRKKEFDGLRQVRDDDDEKKEISPYLFPAGAVGAGVAANVYAAGNLRKDDFIDRQMKNLRGSLERKLIKPWTDPGQVAKANKKIDNLIRERRTALEKSRDVVMSSKRPIGEIKYMGHRAGEGIRSGVSKVVHSIPSKIISQSPFGREVLDTARNVRERAGRNEVVNEILSNNKTEGSNVYKNTFESLKKTPVGEATRKVINHTPTRWGVGLAGSALAGGAAVYGISDLLDRHKAKREEEKTAFDKTRFLEGARSKGRNFVRSGVEGSVYFGTPALAGFAVGKNIANPIFDKIEDNSDKMVVEVPIGEVKQRSINLEKQAFANSTGPAALPWGRWAKEVLPDRTMQGMAWATVPAAITVGTGRNIKGRLEKIEGYESKLPPLEEGRARVTIETRPHVNEEKTASDIRKAIDKKIKQVELERRLREQQRKEGTLMNFDGLVEGVRKQQRMQGESEGAAMHGFQE